MCYCDIRKPSFALMHSWMGKAAIDHYPTLFSLAVGFISLHSCVMHDFGVIAGPPQVRQILRIHIM
jgi:hypothetical protein